MHTKNKQTQALAKQAIDDFLGMYNVGEVKATLDNFFHLWMKHRGCGDSTFTLEFFDHYTAMQLILDAANIIQHLEKQEEELLGR